MSTVMNISISELIKVHRSRLKLNQTELAKAVGVSRNYISFIERGHIENVSYGVLQKICKTLGLELQISYSGLVHPLNKS